MFVKMREEEEPPRGPFPIRYEESRERWPVPFDFRYRARAFTWLT